MDQKICHLLVKTPTDDQLSPTNACFDVPKVYVDESHLFRYLLKCKDCGQLYFYEFKEEIDWDKGDDSQYNTYIPVKSEEEADKLNAKSSMELLGVAPRIQNDHGKGNDGKVRMIV